MCIRDRFRLIYIPTLYARPAVTKCDDQFLLLILISRHIFMHYIPTCITMQHWIFIGGQPQLISMTVAQTWDLKPRSQPDLRMSWKRGYSLSLLSGRPDANSGLGTRLVAPRRYDKIRGGHCLWKIKLIILFHFSPVTGEKTCWRTPVRGLKITVLTSQLVFELRSNHQLVLF